MYWKLHSQKCEPSVLDAWRSQNSLRTAPFWFFPHKAHDLAWMGVLGVLRSKPGSPCPSNQPTAGRPVRSSPSGTISSPLVLAGSKVGRPQNGRIGKPTGFLRWGKPDFKIQAQLWNHLLACLFINSFIQRYPFGPCFSGFFSLYLSILHKQNVPQRILLE